MHKPDYEMDLANAKYEELTRQSKKSLLRHCREAEVVCPNGTRLENTKILEFWAEIRLKAKYAKYTNKKPEDYKGPLMCLECSTPFQCDNMKTVIYDRKSLYADAHIHPYTPEKIGELPNDARVYIQRPYGIEVHPIEIQANMWAYLCSEECRHRWKYTKKRICPICKTKINTNI